MGWKAVFIFHQKGSLPTGRTMKEITCLTPSGQIRSIPVDWPTFLPAAFVILLLNETHKRA
jgi:hypothetical protein